MHSGYRQPALPTQGVELGPIKRPSTAILLLTAMLGVLPLSACAYAYVDIDGRPDRTTMTCGRQAETVTCDVFRWWKVDGGWRSENAGRHVGQRESIRYFHVGGRSSKHCIAFDASSSCGGNAKASADTLRALADGASVELDATQSETFGLVMAYGSLTGMLLLPWLMALGVLLGRRSTARLLVWPTHLDLTRRWAGLVTLGVRKIPRAPGETVAVLLESRGGRGDLPTWQLAYQGASTSARLLSIKSVEKPDELERTSERVRDALREIQRAGP